METMETAFGRLTSSEVTEITRQLDQCPWMGGDRICGCIGVKLQRLDLAFKSTGKVKPRLLEILGYTHAH